MINIYLHICELLNIFWVNFSSNVLLIQCLFNRVLCLKFMLVSDIGIFDLFFRKLILNESGVKRGMGNWLIFFMFIFQVTLVCPLYKIIFTINFIWQNPKELIPYLFISTSLSFFFQMFNITVVVVTRSDFHLIFNPRPQWVRGLESSMERTTQ